MLAKKFSFKFHSKDVRIFPFLFSASFFCFPIKILVSLESNSALQRLPHLFFQKARFKQKKCQYRPNIQHIAIKRKLSFFLLRHHSFVENPYSKDIVMQSLIKIYFLVFYIAQKICSYLKFLFVLSTETVLNLKTFNLI